MKFHAQSPWANRMHMLEFIALLSLALVALMSIIPVSESVEATGGETFEEDGLYYKVMSDGDLELISNPVHTYAGSIIVPSTVNHDGHMYDVVSVADCTFDRNVSVTSVYLPDSVTSLGVSVFYQCTNLQSVNLGNALTELKYCSFYECKNLTSISLPDTITSIGYSSFHGCEKLTSITLPSALIEIGNSAFKNCNNLSSITFGNNITTIGEFAFSYCGIIDLTIPNSVVSMSDTVFSFCNSLKSIQFGTGLTAIPRSTFSDCQSLTSVTIDGNITAIGDSAFTSCKSLKTVIIGDNVTTIGEGAFENCYALKHLSLGNSVQTIGARAFYTTLIYRVTLPSSLTSLGEDSFNSNYLYDICNNSSIELHVIDSEHPESHISGINRNAKNIYSSLSGSSMFHEMAIDTSSTAVYYRSIQDSTLTLIDVIGDHTDLILPDSINGDNYTLEQDAFAYDIDIQSLTIGNGVTLIMQYAFLDCINLSEINFGTGNVNLFGSVFGGCTSLTSVSIPSNIKNVGGFGYCRNLTNVTIAEGVEGIGTGAFQNTGISTIVLPNSLKTIGYQAFYNTDLTSITFGTGLVSLSYVAFQGYTFYDSDGITVLDHTANNMKGFTFVGTSKTNMVKLLNTCAITFCKDDGAVHTIKVYEEGTSLNSFDVTLKKEDTAQYTYTFSGWKYANNTTVTFPFVVNSNVSLYPVWIETLRNYTVNYYNGTVLDHSSTVNYGTTFINTPITKEPTVQYTYQFSCWRDSNNSVVDENTVIIGNLNVYAEFISTLNKYLIKFIDWDDSEISEDYLDYGSAIVTPESPIRPSTGTYSYTFSGWNGYSSGMTVTGSATFKAQYTETPMLYQVIYKLDDSVLYTESCQVGAEVTLREPYSVTGYITSWSPSVIAIEGKFIMPEADVTISLVLVPNTYNIKFYDEDKTTVIYEGTKNYNENMPVITPIKTSTDQFAYEFTGWTDVDGNPIAVGNIVTSDVTAYASYTQSTRSYYVLHYSDSGNLIQSGVYDYGTVITPIAGPVKDSDGMFTYTFNSWYGYSEGMTVQGRTVLTAVYDKTPIIPDDKNEVVIYAAEDGFVKFTDDNIEDLKEKAKTEDVSLTVTVSEGTVVFDKEAIKTFTSGNDLSISKLDNEKFDQSIKDIVGDAPTYEIYFGENRNFGEGSATITVPYTLKEGDDPNNLVVYYLQDGRVVQRIDCTYENGYVTFVTNHFSTYAIVSEEASNDNGSNIGLIIGAVFVVLAAEIIAAAIIVKKH